MYRDELIPQAAALCFFTMTSEYGSVFRKQSTAGGVAVATTVRDNEPLHDTFTYTLSSKFG